MKVKKAGKLPDNPTKGQQVKVGKVTYRWTGLLWLIVTEFKDYYPG